MRIRFFTCIIIIVLLFGCKNTGREVGHSSVFTIATLKGPSSMGMIRLIDSLDRTGDHSLQVKILNEPIQVRKMMIEGTADFAILPLTMAAILYNKELEYKLVAVPVWGTLYLFGSDTTITNWDDLRGKRVHVMARGMTPDVLFRYLLRQNGINPETDMILDYSFPTHIDLANAVAAGQAELGVISEPLVSLVMQRNKQVRSVFDLNEEWNKKQGVPIAQTAFLASDAIMRDHTQLAEQVVAACAASTRWVNRHPDSAATMIVNHHILPDHDVALHAIPRSNLKFVRAKSIKTQIEEYLNIFYRMNPDIIGGKIPDEDFYY